MRARFFPRFLFVLALVPAFLISEAQASEIPRLAEAAERVQSRLFSHEDAGLRTFSAGISGSLIDREVQEMGLVPVGPVVLHLHWSAPDSVAFDISGVEVTPRELLKLVDETDWIVRCLVYFHFHFLDDDSDVVRSDAAGVLVDGMWRYVTDEGMNVFIDPADFSIRTLMDEEMRIDFRWTQEKGKNLLSEAVVSGFDVDSVEKVSAVALVTRYAEREGVLVPMELNGYFADETGKSRVLFGSMVVSDQEVNRPIDREVFRKYSAMASTVSHFESDFGYRIEFSPEWELAEDFAEYDIAAFRDEGRIGAGMLIQPLGGAGLERYFDFRRRILAEKFPIIDDEPTSASTLGARPARTLNLKVQGDNGELRFRSRAFTREGLVYELVVWGGEEDAVKIERYLDDLAGRVIVTDDLTSWMNRASEAIEVSGTGFTLQAPAGWSLTDPETLDPSADIAMAHRFGWSFMVAYYGEGGISIPEFEAAGMPDLTRPEVISRRTGRLGNADVSEVRTEGEVDGIAFRYVSLYAVSESESLQIVGWCMRDAAPVVEPRLVELIGSLARAGRRIRWNSGSAPPVPGKRTRFEL